MFSRAFVRKRVISLAASTSVAIASLALAQGSTPAEHIRYAIPPPHVADRKDRDNESPFMSENAAAMNKVMAQSDVSATSKATNYLPSISDFMIATIQPRHIRLWLAAHSKDWPFAAYELGNLKGAFDRLGQAHPMEHEIPLQDMISSVTAQPFEDLRKAIQAKDATAFDKAYGDLTSACNACHQGTNHGVVVIRAPTDASLSDQDFGSTAP